MNGHVDDNGHGRVVQGLLAVWPHVGTVGQVERVWAHHHFGGVVEQETVRPEQVEFSKTLLSRFSESEFDGSVYLLKDICIVDANRRVKQGLLDTCRVDVCRSSAFWYDTRQEGDGTSHDLQKLRINFLLFISLVCYWRRDTGPRQRSTPAVDARALHLGAVGNQVWLDSSIASGQLPRRHAS